MLEARVHPLVVAILRLKVMFLIAEPIIASWFTPAAFARLGASVVPSADEVPHAVIVPSALKAAKANIVEYWQTQSLQH
jgi:hypothetical protein